MDEGFAIPSTALGVLKGTAAIPVTEILFRYRYQYRELNFGAKGEEAANFSEQ
jgi:hypothetical protein